MKKQLFALFGAVALLAGMPAFVPSASAAGHRQKKKNDWRNAAIGSGAVAGYGLLKGNKTAAILGAAGAAYSANRYEQERKHQDERKRARARYRRHGGNYVRNGRKYYKFHGHMYFKDLRTGERHRVK